MPSGGSGTVTDQLLPLTEITVPRNIVQTDHRTYMGNLAHALIGINEPLKGVKFNPIEYGYAFSKDLPNDHYIIMDRYPSLPFWNRHYAYPMMEELSNFTYTKTGASHLFRQYNNLMLHLVVEDTAIASDGYKYCNNVLAFTY